MAIFFTTNATQSENSNILESEKIASLSVKAWAGQAGESAYFRIGNETGADISDMLVYSNSAVVELSTDKRYWGPATNYSVANGKVGDAIHVRALADIEATEAESAATVFTDYDSLAVSVFIASVNEGDTDRSQAYRFTGDNTREIGEFFGTDGEAVRIVEYTPLPKPNPTPQTGVVYSNTDLQNMRIEEWVNPMNSIVGFKSVYWSTYAFVGDREKLLNLQYEWEQPTSTLSDTNAIILPATFPGFNPSWRKTIVDFGTVGPNQYSYQGTVWTIHRDNQEYALTNIRRAGFFKGQIIFWYADLHRIHYPAGSNTDSYLPWNELIDTDWKVIGYVKSWSDNIVESAYEYTGSEYDASQYIPEDETDTCPTCPTCPTAPAFVSATLSPDDKTLTVMFDQTLQSATLDASNWRWFTGLERYIATSATASGNQVVATTTNFGVAIATARGCYYSPPAHDVIGANGIAAYAFEGKTID